MSSFYQAENRRNFAASKRQNRSLTSLTQRNLQKAGEGLQLLHEGSSKIGCLGFVNLSSILLVLLVGPGRT